MQGAQEVCCISATMLEWLHQGQAELKSEKYTSALGVCACQQMQCTESDILMRSTC